MKRKLAIFVFSLILSIASVTVSASESTEPEIVIHEDEISDITLAASSEEKQDDDVLFIISFIIGAPAIICYILGRKRGKHVATKKILASDNSGYKRNVSKHQDIPENKDVSALDLEIREKKKQIIELNEAILVQEFGLYDTQFEFASSIDYKDELAKIRNKEKDLLKNGEAVNGAVGWAVDGNKAKGKKMISDIQKLVMRAFNNECDDIISKVKYTNYDASVDRIYKSAQAIERLGEMMNISIKSQYIDCKIRELRLAFEYQQKKQQEKEDAKAAREALREAAKLEKEIEAQRRIVEKEQTHYETALATLDRQISENPDDRELAKRKEEILKRLGDIEKNLKDIDYREANQKAGYVYIISNIGSFGKDVYKIGMTRRLNPQERVDELGDASVPFAFDVHAMIFSDDAPALEAALHRAFENNKVNMVNQRREFFHVSLDEIKEVIKENFDKTVEFIDIPDAEQYRVSEKIRAQLN